MIEPRTCNRTNCYDTQDPNSPLFLCRRHQSLVDAKKLGWDDNVDRGHIYSQAMGLLGEIQEERSLN